MNPKSSAISALIRKARPSRLYERLLLGVLLCLPPVAGFADVQVGESENWTYNLSADIDDPEAFFKAIGDELGAV